MVKEASLYAGNGEDSKESGRNEVKVEKEIVADNKGYAEKVGSSIRNIVLNSRKQRQPLLGTFKQ